MSATNAGQRGFSLLEVLVAFAILAVSLGVLMQIFSRAALSASATDRYSRAASLAEARLEAVGRAIPLAEGSISCDPEDGFVWELTMVPTNLGLTESGLLEDLELHRGEDLPAAPYLVSVTVLWQEGGEPRRLTVSSVRIGKREL